MQGCLTISDGIIQYEGEAEYFRKSAKAFREQGVRLLGGCCGTTPDHIRAIASELKGLVPVKEKTITVKEKKMTVEVKEIQREIFLFKK